MKKAKKMTAVTLTAALLLSSIPGNVFAGGRDEEKANSKIQAEFFVSPDGDDQNPGTYDKPFATLQAARDAVREINDNMTGDIYVFVDGGKYYLDETLELNEEDSGTNGYQVVYRNLDGLGSAELIGGKKLESEWELVDGSGDPTVDPDADLPESAEGKVYKTHVGTEVAFYTLYVNDRRATLARTGNREIYENYSAALTPYMRTTGGGLRTLGYNRNDIPEEVLEGLVNAQSRGDLNASVYLWDGGYWDWMTDTIPVERIDVENDTLYYKQDSEHPELYVPHFNTGVNARYFIQGNLSMLDVPGEYYFNHTTGDLYYYPESGNIEDYEFVIPTMEKIVDIKGTSKDSMVENITFDGLQFKDTSTPEYYTYAWNWGDAGAGLGFYPPEAEGSTQPSYCEQTERVEYQVGAITLTNTQNITITNSHIKNTGMFGVELYLANQETEISNCLIEYTGHGGVHIDGGYPGVGGDENGDGYSRDNVVTNCIIHDIGELIGQASGVTIINSGYNTVSHMEIYNSPRRGVFISGAVSRNPNVAFPDGDKDYNKMTDLYTHHNTVEYVYIHNCQQDGGDDGAIFAQNLFDPGAYKPNYFNQILIDTVASNPSMTDIAPNGINIDGQTSGVELKDVKVVNPQHFNIEVSTLAQYGTVMKFENTNTKFGNLKNEIDEFDDSRMEYDKIGVTTDFPQEYEQPAEQPQKPENLYFEEDFETGIETGKWSMSGQTPKITTEFMSEGVYGGKQALEISGNGQLYRTFEQPLQKTASFKIFDRQNNNQPAYTSGVTYSAKATAIVRADDGENAIGMGIDFDNMNYYVVQVGEERIPTPVRRTCGWHEFTFDYTSGTGVDLYVDGQLVKTIEDVDGFSYISLGTAEGKGTAYYDEVSIYGGDTDTPAWGDVELPEVPESDAEFNKEVFHKDFEDGVGIEFDPIKTFGGTNTTNLVEGDADHGQVMELLLDCGNVYYEVDNKDWKNYVIKYDWKFDGWQNSPLGYDNLGVVVAANTKDGARPVTSPACYQVVYRRNEGGTPYFELYKYDGGDTTFGKYTPPEDFDVTQWHSYEIHTFNGNLGLVIDGEMVVTGKDNNPLTYGGIGFNSVNTKSYVDNIQIINNPQNAEYDPNFGLENAKINGVFNPDYYEYSATIIDAEQPVTLAAPKAVASNVDFRIMLNGEDISSQFENPDNRVELSLQKGINQLSIIEITPAGEKEYRIQIEKPYQIISAEELADVETTLGTAPQLPQEVTLHFDDETSQTVGIQWDTVLPAQYRHTGKFTVEGKAEGFAYEVSVTVSVKGLESVEELPMIETEAGTAPTLAKSLLAHYSDGDAELPLTFCKLSPALYQKAGTVIAIGYADGYSRPVMQLVQVKEPVKEVDKTLLQKTYDYALEQDISNLIDSVKAYYEEALSEGKAVLDDVNATQAEVDAATDKLFNAVWMLDFVKGNKTNLGMLIERAEGMAANAEKYVQGDIWQQLLDALDTAKTVYEDGDAMESDIQPVADELLKAIVAQRYKADKSILEGLINKANAMDVSQYTAESVAVFKAALANANLVLADESLSEDDQSVVDNAVKELDDAIKNLSTADETPSNPDDPSGPDDGEETPSTPDKGDEGTPATGDYSDIAILFTAAFAAMMLAALACNWRKRKTDE